MNISKYLFEIFGVVFFILISGVANAGMRDVNDDDVMWNFVYEGDVLPSDDTIAPFALDRQKEAPVEEVVEESGNSVLRQTIKQGGWGWRIAVEKDISLMMEMRARIVSGTGFLLGAELRNGDDGHVVLKVSPDSIVFGCPPNLTTIPINSGEDFHVYRLTVESSGAKLYLDGDPNSIAEVPTDPVRGTWIAFGNFGSLNGTGVVEYDYVKWTRGDTSAPKAPSKK